MCEKDCFAKIGFFASGVTQTKLCTSVELPCQELENTLSLQKQNPFFCSK